jgi:hypothetical protein
VDVTLKTLNSRWQELGLPVTKDLTVPVSRSLTITIMFAYMSGVKALAVKDNNSRAENMLAVCQSQDVVRLGDRNWSRR